MRKATYHAMCMLMFAMISLLGGCSVDSHPTTFENTARTYVAATPAPDLDNNPAALYSSVLTERRVVGLILEGYIDDDTMRSLEGVLKANNIHCVFFISGIDAYEHPDIVREIASAGFLIGNYGINASKKMEDNDSQKNIHQFQRGQELLYEVADIKPTLFRCNGSKYTREVLQAAALVGLHAGVNPDTYLNHRSFDEKTDAILFVQKLTRGSIISIKLGQELNDNEYGGTKENPNRLVIDPPPFLSDNMEETIHTTYANVVSVVTWLLEALNSEGYVVLSPEELQAEQLTAFDSPIILDEETLTMLDPYTYVLPTTSSPLGAPESDLVDDTALDGAVFVGDSIMAGLADYVAWRREANPDYLGTAQFLTTTNLGIISAEMNVSPISVHPELAGVKMTIGKALNKLGAKTLYLMPGLSDARNNTPEKVIENLKLLIYQVERENPGIRIYLLSIPPGVVGHYADPTNAKIFQCNLAVCKFSLQYGICFVDSAFVLRDENGDLPTDFCMDPDTYGVHLSDEGCERWIQYILSHMPS